VALRHFGTASTQRKPAWRAFLVLRDAFGIATASVVEETGLKAIVHLLNVAATRPGNNWLLCARQFYKLPAPSVLATCTLEL